MRMAGATATYIPNDTVVLKKSISRVINMTTGNAKPLVIVNGKEDSLFLKSYDPSTIESITVLKDAAAASIYGEKAKNGVIIIVLKDGSKKVKDSLRLKEHKADSTQVKYREKILKARNVLEMEPRPLFVIDGEISNYTDFKSLSIEVIESMNVLKGADAIKKYGEKGEKGVIEIILKK